eukprot:5023301-Ditylum_brightwellii.AAC.1
MAEATTLSEHFHKALSSVSSTSTTVPAKLEIVNRYNQFFSEQQQYSPSFSENESSFKTATPSTSKPMHGVVDAYFDLFPSSTSKEKGK